MPLNSPPPDGPLTMPQGSPPPPPPRRGMLEQVGAKPGGDLTTALTGWARQIQRAAFGEPTTEPKVTSVTLPVREMIVGIRDTRNQPKPDPVALIRRLIARSQRLPYHACPRSIECQFCGEESGYHEAQPRHAPDCPYVEAVRLYGQPDA